ncbi:MAG: GTP-binding protein, partial [Prevotella sp.]|nr:GTP-binding protein [Prevotella sp.]
QIEFCNIILLNKASEVEPSELERLKEIITALQPHATIIECDYGNVDLDKIINTHLFDFDKVATSAAWIDEIEHHHDDEHDDDDDDDDHEGHHHHHHEHDHEGGEVEEYGIGTFVYYRRKPFDLVGFDEFIASKWSKNIIRCKGICWFKDEPATCYVFEQAGKQMNLRNAGQWYATMDKDELADLMQREPGLSQDWNEQYGDRMQKLVFIGQHLDKDEITRQLDSILLD